LNKEKSYIKLSSFLELYYNKNLFKASSCFLVMTDAIKPRPCLGWCNKIYEESTPYRRVCPECKKGIDNSHINTRYDSSRLTKMGIEDGEQDRDRAS